MAELFSPFQLVLFDSLHEGLAHIDGQGGVVFANRAAAEIMGVPLDMIRKTRMTMPPWDACREDGSPFPVAERPAMLTARTGIAQENVVMGITHADGHLSWLRVSSRPILEADGTTVSGIILTFLDITQKRRTERLQTLRLKLREFAAVHGVAPTMEWFVQACQTLTSSSLAHLQLHRGAPLPRTWGDHGSSERSMTVDVREGDRVWAQVTVSGKNHPYTDVDRTSLEEFLSSFQDVLMQKHTEEHLLQKQAGLETSIHAFGFARSSGEITDVNPAFLALWELDEPSQVIGRNAARFWPNLQGAADVRRQVLSTGHWQGDLSIITRKGKVRVVASTVHQVRDAGGVPAGFMATFADMTEQRDAEDQLREQKEYLRIITETLPDSLFLADREGKITYVNRVFPWLSVDDVLGSRVEDWVPEAYRSTIRRALEKAFIQLEPSSYLSPGPGPEGASLEFQIKVVPLIHKGVATSALFLARDMTNDLKWVEAAQKNLQLESLGLLAGGIAHDFNNLLTSLYGSLDLALLTPQSPEQQAHLEKAVQSLERARGLTQQLLTFSKGGEPIKKPSALFPYVREVVEFTLSGSAVLARFDVATDLGEFLIDRSQISQVVSNITLNAVQAMSEGGELFVSARPVKGVGGHVELLFRDQGAGMVPEILARVFDPFFTTKPHGNGLGLATSHSIISRHGGTLEAFSDGPGQGTTLRIVLPCRVPERSGPSQVAKALPRGSGRVLVMDDDAMVRTILSSMLQNLGYETVGVSSGEAAIARARQAEAEGESFTLALLDLTVPGGLGGIETASQLARHLPGLPLVVASGYSSDPVLARPVDYGFVAGICKPFLIKDLAETLARYSRR